MPVTPSGFLSLKVHEFRTALSQSADFQTWTSTANAAAALAKIYSPIAPVGAVPPFAVVDFGGGFSLQNIADLQYDFTGDIWFFFRGLITQADPIDALYEFTNPIGAILEDLSEVGKTGGYFPLDSIDLLYGPVRSDWFEEKIDIKYYEAAFSARYGV
jgi:hypothetical protein